MKRIASTVAVAVLAMTFAACGSHTDSVTAPLSLQLSADDTLQAVMHSAVQATMADVDVLNSAAAPVGFDFAVAAAAPMSLGVAGPTSAANDFASSGCILNASTGRFDCPPVVNSNGITVTRSLALYDANGGLMSKFDSTTASMNVQSTEVGVRTGAAGADTISRARNLTATGLLGHNTTRTWNGTGGGTSGGYWADSVASRTADTQGASIFTNIVVQLPRSQNPYPISGTISRQVNGTGQVTKHGQTKPITINRAVLITFNGTEFVPMTVGSVNYILDLATGKATKQ